MFHAPTLFERFFSPCLKEADPEEEGCSPCLCLPDVSLRLMSLLLSLLTTGRASLVNQQEVPQLVGQGCSSFISCLLSPAPSDSKGE